MRTALIKGPLPPGMSSVRVGEPFVEAALQEVSRLSASRVFVLANRSSVGRAGPLVQALQDRALLAAPLCSSIGMGGGETGLLHACDAAAGGHSDCVLTVGGGAVQDAGKLIRLWLSAADGQSSSVEGILAAARRDPMPPLPPQIALPNSFAMAELTSVAGITLTNNVKSGAAHPALMPTAVVFDPALAAGLPDWVRFGTGLRCVEHAVGAVTHPQANTQIEGQALRGLEMVASGLRRMLSDPECYDAQIKLYIGGWLAIRALNTGCYPALGHLLANHYSARYNVHQGSCSGVRLLLGGLSRPGAVCPRACAPRGRHDG